MSEDQPTADDQARFWLSLSRDMAVARRVYASVHAGNADAAQSIIAEVTTTGRGSQVLFAAIVQGLQWLHALVPDVDEAARILDRLAVVQLDEAAEADELLKRLDEDGNGDGDGSAGQGPPIL